MTPVLSGLCHCGSLLGPIPLPAERLAEAPDAIAEAGWGYDGRGRLTCQLCLAEPDRPEAAPPQPAQGTLFA
jgi:hypothetical protein